MSKVRQSNIELLRAVIMFMILLLHANVSTFGWPKDDSTVGLWRLLAESLTIVAPNVFVLITGYFGTTLKLSRICNLLFQIVFTVFSVTILLIVLNLYQYDNWKELIHGFYFWNYWFLNSYIVLLLLSPLPNLAVKYLSKSFIRILLISLFVVFCVLDGDFFISPPGIGVNSGYSVMWFVFLYLLGRYLALYPLKCRIIELFLVYLMSVAGAFLLMWKCHDFGYNSPFILIESVAFFLMFLKLDFSSHWVNFIASSSLMVFLLHCHPVLMNVYKSILKTMNNKYGEGAEFVFLVLSFCIIVYAVAIIYDQVRKLIWKQIEPHVKKWDGIISINE